MTALATGTRVGVYEVVSLLGAGGMGEVYRARDTKLGRDVAIKVLPATRSLATAALEWFDAAADGTRFLIACGAEDAPSPIVVSVDWTASLK